MLAVVAAPIGRVIVAAVAYARESDWLMLGVSIAILAVIAIGVISSLDVRGLIDGHRRSSPWRSWSS